MIRYVRDFEDSIERLKEAYEIGQDTFGKSRPNKIKGDRQVPEKESRWRQRSARFSYS